MKPISARLRRNAIPLVLLAVAWVAILANRELRGMLRVEVVGDSKVGVWPEYPWTPRLEGRDYDPDRLTARFPNDPQVAAYAAERLPYGTNDRARAFDVLMHRFPDQAWIAARRL